MCLIGCLTGCYLTNGFSLYIILLCFAEDLGVWLAVLLGASLLTLIEICDIILAWLSEKFCDGRHPPDVDKAFPPEYRNKVKPPESLNNSCSLRGDTDLNSSCNSSNRRSYVTFRDYNHIGGSEV